MAEEQDSLHQLHRVQALIGQLRKGFHLSANGYYAINVEYKTLHILIRLAIEELFAEEGFHLGVPGSPEDRLL